MEYTIQELGNLASISTRTIRYYDEIELLKPARINSSGYRIYGQQEVDTLQQNLFYRELGVSLEEIKKIIYSPSFNVKIALKEHYQKLLEKRAQLDQLITNVRNSIDTVEGRNRMTNKDKFKGFKQSLIEENEEKYGKEIREKYGEETINQSNAKLMNMSEEDYLKMTEIENTLFAVLIEAMETRNPASPLAQKAADLHKQWLSFTWQNYSKEAHAGLAGMYVEDERFTAYYDKKKAGAALFLRDAIMVYTQ